MIKNFIKRIITEVIKELISPELMRFEQSDVISAGSVQERDENKV
jgi:hypothetical protein